MNPRNVRKEDSMRPTRVRLHHPAASVRASSVHRGTGSNRTHNATGVRRTVALVAGLLLPSASYAGPILESADRFATALVPALSENGQPQGCASATAAGQIAAEHDESSTGYLVGGIFIPVIMPLIAMASSPSPSTNLTSNQHNQDLPCFRDGYRQRGRSKKVRGGWIGSAIGIGLYVGLAAAAVAASDDYRRF